ncbi:hypothetical protein C8A00DRAFT_31775 [Chaetomidium leptoderma]|uniref:Ubiquitin carboxyl-terminal hydrolase n=1 Tax=Chaetomidium leptoderma TaxID=669021 RepID=A0AAN6ZYZ6_9PEZI|nr:hypothetical protein C8A00DRAFT_31775 [Chaetomidium leptoderma]
MPDKTLRVVTYAAGASLAAITLVYVFGPTYFLDSDASSSASSAFSTRKKGVVGLSNPANDCFINSVLQALAGLGDLRLYLIRETHRRSLDDEIVYTQPVPAGAWDGHEKETLMPQFGKDIPDWKMEGLQKGSVTKNLKEILDALNERPIYKKTISAASFVRALEDAFRQRISRQQQDAQEFLQVVAERLCDEYHAGRRARRFARRIVALDDRLLGAQAIAAEESGAGRPRSPSASGRGDLEDGDNVNGGEQNVEEEEGFPLEGRFESQIECLTCGFKPRPTTSTFCTLTLHVPQVPSTTLGACFDGMFKTEYIDDFKCEKCRLLHALALFESERRRPSSDAARARAQTAVERLQLAIDTDPEKPPEDVALPDLRYAPKRRIARHIRMTEFPKILAVHLSRSIFDASHSSQKNSAKVAFPEELPLGGLLQQQKYKLLGVVTHKGSHHSGHYESFRRQNIYPPFSNPSTFQPSGAYSRRASPASTPRIPAEEGQQLPEKKSVAAAPVQGLLTPPSSRPSTTPAGSSRSSLCNDDTRDEKSTAVSRCAAPAVAPRVGDADAEASLLPRSPLTIVPSASRVMAPNAVPAAANDWPSATRPTTAAKSKKRKQQARWWRISDDKIKEASTRDVLGMQREVYLLFYEVERLPL